MDPLILAEKLESLRRCVARIEERRADSAAALDAELASRMRSAVGFRNVAIHSYRRIDWDIVHAITHQDLDDFRRFAAAIDRLVDDE